MREAGKQEGSALVSKMKFNHHRLFIVCERFARYIICMAKIWSVADLLRGNYKQSEYGNPPK